MRQHGISSHTLRVPVPTRVAARVADRPRSDSRSGHHRGLRAMGVLSRRTLSSAADVERLGSASLHGRQRLRPVPCSYSQNRAAVTSFPDRGSAAWRNVCTPRGEQIQLRLVGSMRPGLHTSFDGEAIALDLHYWQAFRSLFGADRRPSFELYGQWRNPNLVLDDRGSLAVAFMPDGSVNRGHLGTRSEPVTITLHEGSFSEFEGACSPHHAS